MFSAPAEMVLRHARTARDAGIDAIRSGETEIDFSSVNAVDSSAVAILLAWQRAAASAGRPLRFHQLPPALASLVAVYGMTELVSA